ncbi:Type II DNA topoisomerase VI subunit B [Gracilaria domingensis]|nr:Type II DNA topoisomerase VI subunit B [Gracilaria domingensis]
MTANDLNLNRTRQIDALLHAARFEKANGSFLSAAGEYNLCLDLTKEFKPNLVATHAEPADVFEGHPFIVEAGVALGGSGMKPGINISRFANRIPLLFEAGNDVVTKTARDSIRWNNYKISPTTDRIGVICSIVSTKIPLKGTGKKYKGDDSDAIKTCVKRAISQCCLQLKTKLVRGAAQKDAAERKKTITKYAPDVANAIIAVFKELHDPEQCTRDPADKIQSVEITRDRLMNKLIEHVQQIDKEQAIEYASATGRHKKQIEAVFLAPRSEEPAYLNI